MFGTHDLVMFVIAGLTVPRANRLPRFPASSQTLPQQQRDQRNRPQGEPRGVEEQRRHRCHALHLGDERESPNQRGQYKTCHTGHFLLLHEHSR